MANLRDIRTRIASVNNTQQITKAMKMVAAAKLRKAQQKMLAARPFAKKLRETTGRLVANTEEAGSLLRVPDSVERILFIVVGSDRGLCGGFNNNLFKEVDHTLKNELSSFRDSGNLDLVCIGRKADAYFRKREYNVVESYPGFFDSLSYEQTTRIMQFAISHFEEKSYDEVYIAFNEFKSVIAQNRITDKVLPVNPDSLIPQQSDEHETSRALDYIFEPGSAEILTALLPLYLNTRLWSAVLESNAAEQGARMAAMDNATENAKELKRELNLTYNRLRQSAITTEISEIVSGAQALEE